MLSNDAAAGANGRKAVRVTITGRVQGVWYRGWTVGMARELGIDGWVRNRSDGSVEALVAGPASQVDKLVDSCRTGPMAARVDAVHAQSAPDPGHIGFEQRATL